MVAFSISYCHLGNIQSIIFLPNNNSKLTLKHTYSYASSTGRQKNMSHLKMSAAMDDSTFSSSSTTTTNTERPLANFHSTVWGDYFLSYTPQLTEISSQEKVEFEELKEKARQMLVETPDNSTQKLELIDIIQRLGVAYHFENEIQTSIKNIFDASQQSKNEDDNLYVVALRFRLTRQQRHYMSSDVFKKFTNKDGKFKETLTKDVQGLLSLYEAAHLRVHGEEILEQGLNFTISHLKSMAPKLSNSLKSQISEALSQPVHINLPRFGAKTYMSLYENDESHNDLLLKFAKLDFNIVQKVYQSELYELTRYWWKDLDYANKFPYARDRLVECYYGAVGGLFEPQYSRTRKFLGKLINIITMVDDTFDAYATFDEIVAFTDAMQRLDISAIDSVPVNLRPAYQVLVDFFNEMGQELAKEGKADRVYYAEFEMKKWIRAYFKEAQWLNAGYIPKCDEYLENGSVSVGITLIAVTSLVCLEELITKETLEWVINDPLILRASGVISRLKDDIIGHVFEQKRGHVASFIECYMKEYGASKQEAYAAAEKEMANAWKDINTEFLRPSQVSMFGLEQIINPTRLVIGFQENDFINTQGEYKDKITSLLVDSVKI